MEKLWEIFKESTLNSTGDVYGKMIHLIVEGRNKADTKEAGRVEKLHEKSNL